MSKQPSHNSAPIDLAHQPDFELGPLTVMPSTREILRPDGSRDVLEPRVMQVLVALQEASPNVVSRDDLIARCWEGRVVGDDAMNAAIGKLRRLSFVIETIPRVGYRLAVQPGQTVSQPAGPRPAGDKPPAGGDNRRALLAGGIVAGAAIVAGGGWWFANHAAAPTQAPPPQSAAASLIARGNEMLRQGRLEAPSQAAALFQQAIDLAPENTDAWAGLGVAYVLLAQNGSKDAYRGQFMRGQSALDRAFALDPHNAAAWAAKSRSYPFRGAWFEAEQTARQGLVFHPNDGGLLLELANRLHVAGRMREAATAMKRCLAAISYQIDPAIAWISISVFTGAGQWVEADQAAARGIAMFPRHPLTWLNRIYLLMYTGRAAMALAILHDNDNRPPDLRDDQVNGVIAVAMAMNSGARGDIDKASAAQLARAQKGDREADNAIMFLAGLGKLDEAFAVAQRSYFGPGANIQPIQYAPCLFQPGCRAMRKDPRFATLMDQMGLAAYWRKAGVKPDYQVYADG
jgi:DNA-binding winged helix-turn-helix (wHTH) protein/tetratricopeptide (TPR) repeat protein